MLTTTSAIILMLNVCSTLFLMGFIWFVQFVQYPLFVHIGTENFSEYQNRYGQRTRILVAAPMLVEAITSVLLIWHPPTATSNALLILGLGLVCVIWSATLFFQTPNHNELLRGFQVSPYRMLVWTNWTRLIAWTLRAILVGWLTMQTMLSQIV